MTEKYRASISNSIHPLNLDLLLFSFFALAVYINISKYELALTYLEAMLTKKPTSARSMRSNYKDLLIIPRSFTATYGDRNFRYSGPFLWNDLPNDLRSCKNLNTFKRKLKTLLFQATFD